jgi:ubiquinone/menaquinone biosynthesis C-methylase UbiE
MPTLYDRGAYEKIEDNAADMHDHLIRALGVRAGERWLDIATGTGAVALKAARLGADVTGQDLSSRLIRIAAEKAVSAGLSTRFAVGDCERLPDPDASYDVVSSSVGAVFAPDHRAVARQLARVLRKGGVLASRHGGRKGERLRCGKSKASTGPRRRRVQPLLSTGAGLTMYRSRLPTTCSSNSKKAPACWLASLPSPSRKDS